MTFKQIDRTDRFNKDLKKLLKRFPSLEEDLKTLANTLLTLFHIHKIDVDGVERMNNLTFDYPPIYKVTKFACKALKGKGARSGMRLIYSYHPDEKKVVFIELYYKGDKERADHEYLKLLYNH